MFPKSSFVVSHPLAKLNSLVNSPLIPLLSSLILLRLDYHPLKTPHFLRAIRMPTHWLRDFHIFRKAFGVTGVAIPLSQCPDFSYPLIDLMTLRILFSLSQGPFVTALFRISWAKENAPDTIAATQYGFGYLRLCSTSRRLPMANKFSKLQLQEFTRGMIQNTVKQR